ncbi:CBS domain containing-hemolysin-like protein [Silvibacterium bohemicum]|uniref:CBS domain containing-hemolysin-like protein n=1 Tax=Silvibacterium bohemicum TaxID=1577686 RepID=A0A841K0A5_9BACT|nr:hemolysin family protein [Silvibacterium bohemicum]MBB6146037.1 CBS domain containing-hemolysin-like protein [Silvibacterium bohemicum]
MTLTAAIPIVILLIVLTLASYVDRLYSEMGKFLAREFQENIDAWEQHVEPKLRLERDHVALSAAILSQLALAGLTLLFGMLLFDRTPADRPTAPEVAQVVLGVILVILLFNQFLPFVFFTRTQGLWIIRWRRFLQFLFYLMMPITLFLGFLLSVASLAEAPAKKEEEATTEAVEALLEAGEEEGILEESDRELVRSAVEFGDKVVREVMTPRPEIFAVPGNTTIEEFLHLLRSEVYSRVPVFEGTLDQIAGIAFAHDLLHIRDVDARTQMVSSIQRQATFVPETKKVNELLREMQREKQHMRIVIDEYGGVAGLVTIEDLLEELVGTIRDEHDDDADGVLREPDGSWAVPGNLEIERLEELLGGETEMPEDYEATTVAGLVSETAGRIPQAGEVVEEYGLRFEILASTDRRIERLRVSRLEESSER